MILLTSALAAAPWTVVRKELTSEAIQLDGIIRTTARWELEPEDADRQGFRWRFVRARLMGRLHPTVDYALQGQAAEKVALMDAWMRWAPHQAFRLMAGWFRPALSVETTSPLMTLPFTLRSTPAERLGPVRDWGLGLAGNAGVFGYEVDVFQGGVFGDREALPMVTAVTSLNVGEKRHFMIQVGGAVTRDRGTDWAGTDFSGDRVTGSIASSWTSTHVTLSAEVLVAAYDPLIGRNDYPMGFHGTIQVRPTRYGELAARVEAWSRSGPPGLNADLVTGARLIPFPEPRPPVQALLNYRIPLHAMRSGDQALELAVQLWL